MISDERLRKKEHILKSGEFRRVYKGARARKYGAIILYCLPNNLGYSRIGFSISTRFVKSAVTRNRIRRIFREAYRKTKPKSDNGLDLVFIVKSDFGGRVSYDMLEKIYLKLLKPSTIGDRIEKMPH